MKNISAYESTIWSSLIITVAASVYFFGKVFGAYADGTPLGVEEIARLGLAMVVIIVAIEVAFNIAMTVWCKGEPQTDERDELIAAKAARNAYYVLVTGIIMLIGHAGLASLLGYIDDLLLDLPLAIVMGIFALVVAEVTHFISRIVYYRIGA
jgi:hypothetical protein